MGGRKSLKTSLASLEGLAHGRAATIKGPAYIVQKSRGTQRGRKEGVFPDDSDAQAGGLYRGQPSSSRRANK